MERTVTRRFAFALLGVGPFYGELRGSRNSDLLVHVEPSELERIERLVGSGLAKIPEYGGGALISHPELVRWRVR